VSLALQKEIVFDVNFLKETVEALFKIICEHGPQ
jgi:hypothetical protein